MDVSKRTQRTAEAPQLLMSVSEVGKMLAVSRTSVYRLIESGELHPIRVLSDPRFLVADVREFVARRHAAATEEGDAGADEPFAA